MLVSKTGKREADQKLGRVKYRKNKHCSTCGILITDYTKSGKCKICSQLKAIRLYKKCAYCHEVFKDYTTKQGLIYCSVKCHGLANTGDKSHRWKGSRASYSAKHMWIRKYYGNPKVCWECGREDKNKMYHWANVSGKYLRDIKDWKRLCVHCHALFDKSFHAGEKAYNSKLTKKAVTDIRRHYVFIKNGASVFAKKYKVTVSCIYRILEGKNWKYV